MDCIGRHSFEYASKARYALSILSFVTLFLLILFLPYRKEGSWGSLNIDRKKGVHLSSKQGSELQLYGAYPETAIGLIYVDNLTGSKKRQKKKEGDEYRWLVWINGCKLACKEVQSRLGIEPMAEALQAERAL